jgi:death-on-curing protein
MKFLSADDIERLHLQIIDASGGSHGLRNRGRIDSAVAAQKQAVFGKEVYGSVFEKAAALVRGIIQDHPFIDGNKRTGVMSGLLFLELNNRDMSKVSDKKLEDFAVKVATESLTVEEITVWLKEHAAQA